jgi:tetratricopeptide (TPR) repeat protein
MTQRKWTLVAGALAAAVLCGSPALAEDAKKTAKDTSSFGVLQAPKADAVKAQALAWLKATGKMDEAAFTAIWESDKPTLDKVALTLALGDSDAAQLLTQARDDSNPAPTAVPALLKDATKPLFYRANLALAYGKALAARKVYDEALEALKAVRPEQVIDPASYFFHKAVAEHALMLKTEADDSIFRLLDDVVDAPERYKMVAALMHFDMMTWQEKDLGWISRKMDVVKDRLELTRGGKKTQKMQKEIVARLEEMIKELENQKSNSSSSNGGNCPSGGSSGPPNGSIPSGTPATDFGLPNGQKQGVVDSKRLKEIADIWGKLPEKERAKAMLELTRDLPPRYRETIEKYLKDLSARTTPEDKK